jgi:hypothetical protein
LWRCIWSCRARSRWRWSVTNDVNKNFCKRFDNSQWFLKTVLMAYWWLVATIPQ